MNLIPLVGKKFGKLLVIEQMAKKTPAGHIFWKCKCDCGQLHEVVGFALRHGKCKSCGKCPRIAHNRNPNREEAILKSLYIFSKNRDKHYGGKFNLTFKEFVKLSKQRCHYCKLKSSNKAKDHKRNGTFYSDTIVYFNGLDRVNSSIGYIKSNVVPCCKFCNRAKNDMSLSEYTEFIKRVYNNFVL